MINKCDRCGAKQAMKAVIFQGYDRSLCHGCSSSFVLWLRGGAVRKGPPERGEERGT